MVETHGFELKLQHFPSIRDGGDKLFGSAWKVK